MEFIELTESRQKEIISAIREDLIHYCITLIKEELNNGKENIKNYCISSHCGTFFLVNIHKGELLDFTISEYDDETEKDFTIRIDKELISNLLSYQ